MMRHCGSRSPGRRTLVFQEIAHPRPSREDQLGHILHDLGLGLVRQGLEPFGQPDFPYERSADHGPGRGTITRRNEVGSGTRDRS